MKYLMRGLRISIFHRLTSLKKGSTYQKIEDLQQPQASNHRAASSFENASNGASAPRRMLRASALSKENKEEKVQPKCQTQPMQN